MNTFTVNEDVTIVLEHVTSVHVRPPSVSEFSSSGWQVEVQMVGARYPQTVFGRPNRLYGRNGRYSESPPTDMETIHQQVAEDEMDARICASVLLAKVAACVSA